MKRRERGREIALQALYQLDLRQEEFGPAIVGFLRESTQDAEVYFFSRRLTEGAWAWRAQADRLVREAAEHWTPDRMAAIDRNILRLATYELAECPDIPRRVALDQAIELAKRFSSAESSAFVNGVLDHVLRIIEGEEPAAPVQDPPAAFPATETGRPAENEE
jgi:N utilization substance protein B